VKTLCALLLTLTACGASEVESLKAENVRLATELELTKAKLDDLVNGPAALKALSEVAVKQGDFGTAVAKLEALRKQYPTSPEALASDAPLNAARASLEAETKRKAAEHAALVSKAAAEAEALLKAKEAALAKATGNLKTSYDKMAGVTWYKAKSAKVLGNYLQVYFGRFDKGTVGPLRLDAQYYGDEWVFFDELIVKADDAVFNFPKLRPQQDNSGGSVWETIDTPVTSEMVRMLRAVIAAKDVSIRFDGKHVKDFDLTPASRAALRDMLIAYEAFGGSLP
jgi:hypothetical protein